MVSGGDKCFGGRGNEGEEKEFHRWEDVPLIANVMWDRSGVVCRAIGGRRRLGWAETTVAHRVVRGPCLG
jgi:hypothetical protein